MFIRQLWEATEEGGVEAALALTDPDAQWIPFEAGGRTFSSSELLGWLGQYEGDRAILSARAHTIKEHGRCVLASGTFRITGPQGLVEHHVTWLSEFEDGKLVRARSFPTYAQAAEAAGLDPSGEA
jgi:ketosteroid isomerase-like protein